MALSGGIERSRATRVRSRAACCIWLALAYVFFAGSAAANDVAEPSATDLIEGLLSGHAQVGGSFVLTDQTGQRRSDVDFRGKLVVLYFGYTHCPDVCPTELQSISLALDRLGPASVKVQPLFITVDPERDTPARLSSFVSAFHPRLIGLTGSPAEIRQTATAYRAFFAKHKDATSSDYSVDHSGFIYLIGQDGRYLGFLPPGLSPDEITDEIRIRLGTE